MATTTVILLERIGYTFISSGEPLCIVLQDGVTMGGSMDFNRIAELIGYNLYAPEVFIQWLYGLAEPFHITVDYLAATQKERPWKLPVRYRGLHVVYAPGESEVSKSWKITDPWAFGGLSVTIFGSSDLSEKVIVSEKILNLTFTRSRHAACFIVGGDDIKFGRDSAIFRFLCSGGTIKLDEIFLGMRDVSFKDVECLSAKNISEHIDECNVFDWNCSPTGLRDLKNVYLSSSFNKGTFGDITIDACEVTDCFNKGTYGRVQFIGSHGAVMLNRTFEDASCVSVILPQESVVFNSFSRADIACKMDLSRVTSVSASFIDTKCAVTLPSFFNSFTGNCFMGMGLHEFYAFAFEDISYESDKKLKLTWLDSTITNDYSGKFSAFLRVKADELFVGKFIRCELPRHFLYNVSGKIMFKLGSVTQLTHEAVEKYNSDELDTSFLPNVTEFTNKNFVNCTARHVIIHNKAKTLKPNAFCEFSNCKTVFIPASVTSISRDWLTGVAVYTVYTVNDSYAAKFAARYSMQCVLVQNVEEYRERRESGENIEDKYASAVMLAELSGIESETGISAAVKHSLIVTGIADNIFEKYPVKNSLSAPIPVWASELYAAELAKSAENRDKKLLPCSKREKVFIGVLTNYMPCCTILPELRDSDIVSYSARLTLPGADYSIFECKSAANSNAHIYLIADIKHSQIIHAFTSALTRYDSCADIMSIASVVTNPLADETTQNTQPCSIFNFGEHLSLTGAGPVRIDRETLKYKESFSVFNAIKATFVPCWFEAVKGKLPVLIGIDMHTGEFIEVTLRKFNPPGSNSWSYSRDRAQCYLYHNADSFNIIEPRKPYDAVYGAFNTAVSNAALPIQYCTAIDRCAITDFGLGNPKYADISKFTSFELVDFGLKAGFLTTYKEISKERFSHTPDAAYLPEITFADRVTLTQFGATSEGSSLWIFDTPIKASFPKRFTASIFASALTFKQLKNLCAELSATNVTAVPNGHNNAHFVCKDELLSINDFIIVKTLAVDTYLTDAAAFIGVSKISGKACIAWALFSKRVDGALIKHQSKDVWGRPVITGNIKEQKVAVCFWFNTISNAFAAAYLLGIDIYAHDSNSWVHGFPRTFARRERNGGKFHISFPSTPHKFGSFIFDDFTMKAAELIREGRDNDSFVGSTYQELFDLSVKQPRKV